MGEHSRKIRHRFWLVAAIDAPWMSRAPRIVAGHSQWLPTEVAKEKAPYRGAGAKSSELGRRSISVQKHNTPGGLEFQKQLAPPLCRGLWAGPKRQLGGMGGQMAAVQ
jgi:hypothetical protein